MFKRGLASLIYGKLPQTTVEEAVKCFENAIEINPNRLMHYIELGRLYAQMGRTGEARWFIEKGLDHAERRERRSGDKAARP
jgi:tetratricopeptide (TPR) repeat protein